MSAALESHRWSAQLEDDIYRDVVTRFAPHLPLVRASPRRPATTPAEIEEAIRAVTAGVARLRSLGPR